MPVGRYNSKCQSVTRWCPELVVIVAPPACHLQASINQINQLADCRQTNFAILKQSWMVKRLHIEFSDGRTAYYPGQTLTGTVILELTDSTVALAVYIVIHGQASASISNDGDITHSSSELYINDKIDLWRALTDKETLSSGTHCFSFSFQLPRGLPSSLEYRGGTSIVTRRTAAIQYRLRAKLVRPHHFNVTTEVKFTVLEYIDTNHPSLMRCLTSENEKLLCCCCCASGPLLLSASIDRVGYCPGETVTITALAENYSQRETMGLRARLVAVTTLSSMSAHVTSREAVSELVTRVRIPPGGKDIWRCRRFEIPPLPPTIHNCRVISRDYYIQVEIGVRKGINLETYFPIVIGSVPFEDPSQITRTIRINSRVHPEGRLRWAVPHQSTIPKTFPQSTLSSNELVHMASANVDRYGSMQWSHTDSHYQIQNAFSPMQ